MDINKVYFYPITIYLTSKKVQKSNKNTKFESKGSTLGNGPKVEVSKLGQVSKRLGCTWIILLPIFTECIIWIVLCKGPIHIVLVGKNI